uniref:RRM domain-containing protein n=1 Tax=Aegilops tauschii subsp. strangulata TaxID=200361 RepID=A0A453J5W5_AEGTS
WRPRTRSRERKPTPRRPRSGRSPRRTSGGSPSPPRPTSRPSSRCRSKRHLRSLSQRRRRRRRVGRTTTEEEIRELFDQFGPIRSLQLSRFPDSGNFRGLAFVTFESDEVAMKSLELDGSKIGNRFMRVERCRVTASSKRQKKTEFQSDPEKPDGCLSAYVGNLSWNITEKDLRDFFKSSRIASIRFAIDNRTGDSRGFCHVDFEDDESLEKAVGMNQSELRGRPVKIAYAIINRA